ncbi:MAG TPA: proton-conducting transporter membrane subunit [Candidatus Polarisedimenticolia bacterium]|jgi:hydrogenase-4 component F
MILALVLLPALAGALAFALASNRARRVLMVASAAGHAGMVVFAWLLSPAAIGGWLKLDALGLVTLTIASGLFLASSVYAAGYLEREGRGPRRDFEEGTLFADAPERVFTGCLLLFLAAMTLVTVSHHLGLLWVAVEATTLASAPLIYFHRHHRSLEATWKYLLICSVGIALALLGTFFLAVAGSNSGQEQLPLVLGDLIAAGPSLNRLWLRVAIIFLLVGYGTKMGLAPMHTWLPDAHSESPSLVSALLSGALLNCAFLGILRVVQVSAAASDRAFISGLLVVFGLISMTVAAAFILGQADFKRMLAYSSVEHMGILALGVGLGGAGSFGAMLHSVNHSLTKGCLFLVAGNVLHTYRTKSAREVHGLLRVLPVSGALWVAGFLAIAGSPPFGPFLSELVILRAALDTGRNWVAAVYVALLAIIFVGMSAIVMRMAQPAEAGVDLPAAAGGEAASAILPPLALGAAVLVLGLYVPPALSGLLHEAGLLLEAYQ